jgi:hypothetical protein
MWPLVRRFGLMALGVVALWLITILTLNLTLYSAGGFVMGYLKALEEANYGLAAAKAGVSDVPTVIPMDSEALTNPRIVATGSLATGEIVVQAAYELAGVEETTVFVLDQADPVLWFFNSWKFNRVPTARLDLAVVGDNRVVINGRELQTQRLGVPPRTTVLVPALYEASLSTEWVEAPTVVVSVTDVGSSTTLRLTPSPTPRLLDATSEAVEDFLDDCVVQGVLQPASCPFGITIDDRVIGVPAWTILDYPDVRLNLAGDRASWSMVARRGVAQVSVQVQSLFDGSISETTELISFDLYGVVRGTINDEPVLNLY